MPKRKEKQPPNDLLQGAPGPLILQTALFGPRHGHAIAKSIEQTSRNVSWAGHGSLYLALQRLERRGWVTAAAGGTSEALRRARFYRLTLAGRKQVPVETSRWERLPQAIAHILQPK